MISDFSAATEKLAKRNAFKHNNLYASGINRSLRSHGFRKASTQAVGGAVTVGLSIPAAFTFAYNSTIAAQCAVGIIQ